MIEMPHLPDEVRAILPPVAQAYICALEALVSRQDTQISAMQAQLQTLQAQVTELQARIGQTSQNSSRPPSSDPPSAPPRSQRRASGRKRGGQPGHQRHERPLLPVSEVDEVIEHHAVICPESVSYTHLRAHETRHDLVCRLLLEKKKNIYE